MKRIYRTSITLWLGSWLGLVALQAQAHPELLQSAPTSNASYQQAPTQWQFRLYMPARLVKASVHSRDGEQLLVIAQPQLHSYWKEFALPLPAKLTAGCYMLRAEIVGRDAITRQIEVPFAVARRCDGTPS